MSWREMRLSLQLAADERAGFNMRERQRQLIAMQDQAVAGLSSVAE